MPRSVFLSALFILSVLSVESQDHSFQKKNIVFTVSHDLGHLLFPKASLEPDEKKNTTVKNVIPVVSVGYGLTDFFSLDLKLGYQYRSQEKIIRDINNQVLSVSSYEKKGFATTVSIAWHPGRSARFDPYLGAGFGYEELRTSKAVNYSSVRTENGFSFMIRAGVRYYFSQRMGVMAEAEHRNMPSYFVLGICYKL